MAANPLQKVLPVVVAAGGIMAALASAPIAGADPAADAMVGDYRVVFSNGEVTRTWNITADCMSASEPCVKVVGNGRTAFDAVLDNGRWGFQMPYQTDTTCSNGPLVTSIWSWDPASLTGTMVHHVKAGCGQQEHDEQVGTFTMTKLS